LISRFAVALILVAVMTGASASAATTTMPLLFKNCTHLNAKYHHGVGKYGAHDKTTGVPVTNFFHSTLLYNKAMRYNRGLDRDKDGIACEQH
jgi:Excalibur calcium-binding domain